MGGGGEARFDCLAPDLLTQIPRHIMWTQAWVPCSSPSAVLPKLCELKRVPFLGAPVSSFVQWGSSDFWGPQQLWKPDIAVSIVFLISSSCPPGPRPPVKRQDTGLFPKSILFLELSLLPGGGKAGFPVRMFFVIQTVPVWVAERRRNVSQASKPVNPFPWVWYFHTGIWAP